MGSMYGVELAPKEDVATSEKKRSPSAFSRSSDFGAWGGAGKMPASSTALSNRGVAPARRSSFRGSGSSTQGRGNRRNPLVQLLLALARLTLSLRHFDLKINHPWPRPSGRTRSSSLSKARLPSSSSLFGDLQVARWVCMQLGHTTGAWKPGFIFSLHGTPSSPNHNTEPAG
ncbi:unnamed protein product [Cladocopium goreaui]|uniref:Uncharacterized protein n=1 Tax=Cladocopium goreaui TaxID=2562237 RepID=A0A9P1FUD2_9DINO|nr:unnamed protein product [Cladocopium goreaui]